jgi:membrane dipeptidase
VPTLSAPELGPHLQAALRLHAETLVIDAHADTLDRVLNEGHGFISACDDFHIDLPRMRQTGLNLQLLSLWSPSELTGDQPLVRALSMIASFERMRRESSEVRLVSRVRDIAVDRPAFAFSFEGAEPLGHDLDRLEVFHRLGLRMIGLTWNGRNAFADGQRVGDRPSGLTRLGHELVDRMQHLGVVLDLAHIAEPGFWDAVRDHGGPKVVSHANAASVHPHVRNLTDEQLEAIAASGGVVGVTFVPGFLGSDDVHVGTVADHIEHMWHVMGDEHVGLGSDFDGISRTPAGLSHLGHLPNLTAELLRRGHREERIARLLGLNWARVFQTVWGA